MREVNTFSDTAAGCACPNCGQAGETVIGHLHIVQLGAHNSPAFLEIGLETACPIENFNRLSLHHRRRKRLVPPTIQWFQRFPATLFLYGCPICGQIFGEVGNNIPSDLHGGCGPGIARGELGVYSRGVIYEISVKSGGFDLVLA